MREKEAHLETTWHDPRLGGQLSLRDLSTLEWRKTWLFPGIADAATRVEVRSTLDLQTARPDVRLKLGLRRSFASSGMSFVQDSLTPTLTLFLFLALALALALTLTQPYS